MRRGSGSAEAQVVGNRRLSPAGARGRPKWVEIRRCVGCAGLFEVTRRSRKRWHLQCFRIAQGGRGTPIWVRIQPEMLRVIDRHAESIMEDRGTTIRKLLAGGLARL